MHQVGWCTGAAQHGIIVGEKNMFLNQAHLVDKLFNIFDRGFLIYNTVLVILFHGFAVGINLSNM